MTRSFDVTPKTTKQNLIVRIGKSEAEVTNNKRLRSMYCTGEATYYEASRGLSATAELLVSVGDRRTNKQTNEQTDRRTPPSRKASTSCGGCGPNKSQFSSSVLYIMSQRCARRAIFLPVIIRKINVLWTWT